MGILESDLQIDKWMKGALYSISEILEKNHDAHHIAIDRFIKMQKDVSIVADYFVHYVGKELFGANFSIVAKDYHILLTLISKFEPSFEHYVRNLFVNLVEKKVEYDLLTGKNNLKELSGPIIHEMESWFKALDKGYETNEKVRERVDEGLKKCGGDLNAFKRGILFFAISTLISRAALKIIKNSEVGIKKIKEKVDGIYKKYTSSYEQYKALTDSKPSLIGGILFRGLKLKLNDILRYVENGFIDRGTSWASDWKVSAGFASGLEIGATMNELRMITEAEKVDYKKFVKILTGTLEGKEDYFYNEFGEAINKILVVDFKKLIELLNDFVQVFKCFPGLKIEVRDALHAFIVSYNLFEEKNPKESLLFLGYHRKLIEEKRIISEYETIFIPNKIECTDNSVDIYLLPDTIQMDWKGKVDDELRKKALGIFDELIHKGRTAAENRLAVEIGGMLKKNAEDFLYITKNIFSFYREFLEAAKKTAKDQEALAFISKAEELMASDFKKMVETEEWIKSSIEKLTEEIKAGAFKAEESFLKRIEELFKEIILHWQNADAKMGEFIEKCKQHFDIELVEEEFKEAIKVYEKCSGEINKLLHREHEYERPWDLFKISASVKMIRKILG